MVQWKTNLLLLAISATLAVFGCPAGHSFFSFSRSASSPATASSRSSGRSQEGKREKPAVAKHLWSDSAFPVYRNPDYGISFRYPRNFALQEQSQASDSDSGTAATATPPDSMALDVTATSASASDAADPETPQTQVQQNVAQASAHLIATVSIPSDAYPNTTFESGTLQFLVHRAATESCQPFATEPGSARDGASGTASIQGIPFAWRERSSIETETRHVRREYAGYSAGTCYEFRAEVDTFAKADQDEETTPAVTKKILRILEKIVLSVQIEPKSASAPTRPTTR